MKRMLGILGSVLLMPFISTTNVGKIIDEVQDMAGDSAKVQKVKLCQLPDSEQLLTVGQSELNS